MLISCVELIANKGEFVTKCTVEEAVGRISGDDDLLVLDVREEAEFQSASIPAAVNIPRGFLEFQIAEHCDTADRPILIHCKSGGRAVLAAHTLSEMGYSNLAVVSGNVEDLVAAFT